MSEVDLSSPELQEKIAQLKELLGTPETDETGQVLPDEAVEARKSADGDEVITGKDVNWDEYELDSNYAHFYPRATLRNTEEGPRWTVPIDEFRSASKTYGGRGLEGNGEPRGLGEYLTYMTNGPEGWKIASLLPNGSGLAGILLQRKINVILPEPTMLTTETEVPVPTDGELAVIEADAISWAGVHNEPAQEAQARLEGIFEKKDDYWTPITGAAGNLAAEVLKGPDFGSESIWESIEDDQSINDDQSGEAVETP